MKVKIYTDTIDVLETALLVLPFFTDRRPFKGAAGFVDWRLNGFISRLLVDKRIEPKYFEKILIPPLDRIPPQRVLLVSIGKEAELDGQQMGDFAYRLLETTCKINCFNFALSLPVEMERSDKTKSLIESFFKGVDKFAVKLGPCDYMDNLRITFVLDKSRCPVTIDLLGKYLSSRKVVSQALINA